MSGFVVENPSFSKHPEAASDSVRQLVPLRCSLSSFTWTSNTNHKAKGQIFCQKFVSSNIWLEVFLYTYLNSIWVHLSEARIPTLFLVVYNVSHNVELTFWKRHLMLKEKFPHKLAHGVPACLQSVLGEHSCLLRCSVSRLPRASQNCNWV